MALRLGLLRVSFGELLDPGHHAGRRHPEQLGGAVHREAAQVEQHRRDLDPQRHPARRGVGEVQPAGLAAVALQPLHEAVLDVLLNPATLAPQPHRPAPPVDPPPTDMGRLRSLKTLPRIWLTSGWSTRTRASPATFTSPGSIPTRCGRSPSSVARRWRSTTTCTRNACASLTAGLMVAITGPHRSIHRCRTATGTSSRRTSASRSRWSSRSNTSSTASATGPSRGLMGAAGSP